jgi:hypothetical protein
MGIGRGSVGIYLRRRGQSQFLEGCSEGTRGHTDLEDLGVDAKVAEELGEAALELGEGGGC